MESLNHEFSCSEQQHDTKSRNSFISSNDKKSILDQQGEKKNLEDLFFYDNKTRNQNGDKHGFISKINIVPKNKVNENYISDKHQTDNKSFLEKNNQIAFKARDAYDESIQFIQNIDEVYDKKLDFSDSLSSESEKDTPVASEFNFNENMLGLKETISNKYKFYGVEDVGFKSIAKPEVLKHDVSLESFQNYKLIGDDKNCKSKSKAKENIKILKNFEISESTKYFDEKLNSQALEGL